MDGQIFMIRRGVAAAALLFSLAACANTAGNEPAAPAKDNLTTLNDTFRAAYKDTRAWAIAKSDPVIVVQFDDLHLVRAGAVKTERFTPPIYHEYKAIAHIPLALYVRLARYPGRPFDKEMLDWLTGYLKQVQAAGASLDGGARSPLRLPSMAERSGCTRIRGRRTGAVVRGRAWRRPVLKGGSIYPNRNAPAGKRARAERQSAFNTVSGER